VFPPASHEWREGLPCHLKRNQNSYACTDPGSDIYLRFDLFHDTEKVTVIDTGACIINVFLRKKFKLLVQMKSVVKIVNCSG
jgi:hypothetical protein